MNKHEIAQEALTRATSHAGVMNYGLIFQGFMEKGIDPQDIKPRENVFTFDAWRALGRHVRKGEHGVEVITWITCTKKDKQTGEQDSYRRPKSTYVFHINQTEQDN